MFFSSQRQEASIHDVYLWLRDELKSMGIQASDQESRWILENLLELNHTKLLLARDEEFPLNKITELLDIHARRKAEEPLAYILGKQSFFGHQFMVNSSVLIPRPETEILVEKTLDALSRLNKKRTRVLDVGTGSAAIAVSLCAARPDLVMHAWDISESAKTLAEKNACSILGPEHAINFSKRDALNPESWEGCEFDVIVSNPPYIADFEKTHLERSVFEYEPATALFAGPDPLLFYRKLAEFATQTLARPGIILFELGKNQSEAVRSILTHWRFSEIEVYQDYSSVDRIIKAVLA